MNEQKCINFDWLQVWTYEPIWLRCADAYRNMGFVVKERSFGTRIFDEVLTLIDRNGMPFVEVCRHPKSRKSEGGIIADNACSIRLVNQACYAPTAINDLISFLQDGGFYYKNGKLAGIQRIDIALDFSRFDALEDSPQQFVNDYMSGRYSKVNQPNVRAVGRDGYIWKRYNSLSWGSPSSMVSTKMYCKTQEMAEVKEKPWIRQAWVDSGILSDSLDETPVWRVEFKITGECHEWIDEEGVILHNTLESWSSETNLMQFVKGLISSYFDFRVVMPNVSKYKAEKVDMWRFPKGVLRATPRRKEHFRDTGRAELIMMNKLDRMKQQVSNTSDLSSILAVKNMVHSLYRLKKEGEQLEYVATDADYNRTMEILQAAEDLAPTMAASTNVSECSAMITQVWQSIKQAADCQVLFKSLFPSSRTGVHLSQFLSEWSARGWFVTECNRLKANYLEQAQQRETPLPLLAIWNELLPTGTARNLQENRLRDLYLKNEEENPT